MCDWPLPSSHSQISYFGGQSGYVYLISGNDCNDYYQDSVESYNEIVARKENAENSEDVIIPTNYSTLYEYF